MFKYFLTDSLEYLALGYQCWLVEPKGFHSFKSVREATLPQLRHCKLNWGWGGEEIRKWNF